MGGDRPGAEVTLKVHHFLPPVSHQHKNMLVPWAERIGKESNGRIKVEVYGSMQLGGKPPQLADQARDGVVDIVWTLPGYTPGRFVRTEVFELPFIHSNTKATTLAITEFVQKHGEDFTDYKLLAIHVHAGQVFHSHEPIRTAADLKGLKIRTPTRTGAWMIEAMGRDADRRPGAADSRNAVQEDRRHGDDPLRGDAAAQGQRTGGLSHRAGRPRVPSDQHRGLHAGDEQGQVRVDGPPTFRRCWTTTRA